MRALADLRRRIVHAHSTRTDGGLGGFPRFPGKPHSCNDCGKWVYALNIANSSETGAIGWWHLTSRAL